VQYEERIVAENRWLDFEISIRISEKLSSRNERRNRYGRTGRMAFNDSQESNKDPVDRAIRSEYLNLRDACPICGRVLIEGKCLNCGIRPYEN
jgi:hypothetical protein